eukprot:scaffold51359_cov34-Cyclotella_meneghiniana.AAC.1
MADYSSLMRFGLSREMRAFDGSVRQSRRHRWLHCDLGYHCGCGGPAHCISAVAVRTVAHISVSRMGCRHFSVPRMSCNHFAVTHL